MKTLVTLIVLFLGLPVTAQDLGGSSDIDGWCFDYVFQIKEGNLPNVSKKTEFIRQVEARALKIASEHWGDYDDYVSSIHSSSEMVLDVMYDEVKMALIHTVTGDNFQSLLFYFAQYSHDQEARLLMIEVNDPTEMPGMDYYTSWFCEYK